MVIRHGEKPDATMQGITREGVPDPESLSTTGWARAGGLVELFAPVIGPVRPGLCRPRVLFASNRSGPDGGSARERESVELLAERLGVEVNLRYGAGEESDLVAAAIASEGPVLICWKHDHIAAIAESLVRSDTTVPSHWPRDRFDVVWVFTDPRGEATFSQVPELLLPGDLMTVIS